MEFSKMDIIAASAKDPNVSVRAQRSEVISHLGPAVQVALQFQRILSVVSLSVLLRTYILASHLLLVSKFVAWQALIASRFVLFQTVVTSWVAGRAAWNCRSMRRLRKKFEYEFYTFILGSGGNGLFCMMFWPGWWILGLVTLAIWSCVG
ncbi:uncharacterized protein PG986_005011 [Apiospora aurea]|uniref:Uncharacterized protein n=1 Tax=Apiospora aurea TaxID=335848 RepID=A0ABR1QGC8_9PEZI